MKVFNLEIISPEGRIYKDIVSEVTLPTTTGEITVLANHAPLFTKLSDGEITIFKESGKSFITISGGFLEVSDNKVNVLADYAIRSDKIEEEKIFEARKKAEEAIKHSKDKAAVEAAEKDLRRTLIELKVAEKLKKRSRKSM